MPYDLTRIRLIAAGAVLAELLVPAGSASAQSLNLTAAEQTPAQCDLSIKSADLGSFKAPKANKPYRIEFSVPSFANPR